MKLKREYIVHHSGNESMIITMEEAEFSGIVKGNKVFGLILECLKEDTTEENIVKHLKEKFNDRNDKIERDVKRVVSELTKIGAIEELPTADDTHTKLF